MDQPRGFRISNNEMRLIYFFRCLTPSQEEDLLRSAGELAMERCLPGEDVFHYIPEVAGVQPGPIDGSVYGPNIVGSITEVIRDGIKATGDPASTLLGGNDYFDEIYAVPGFTEGATRSSLHHGYFIKCR